MQEVIDIIRQTVDNNNKLIRSNEMANLKVSKASVEKTAFLASFEITELVSTNEVINKLFVSAREYIELSTDISKCLI